MKEEEEGLGKRKGIVILNRVIRKAFLRKGPLSHSQGKRKERPWWKSAILRGRSLPGRGRSQRKAPPPRKLEGKGTREERGRGVLSGWRSWGLIKPHNVVGIRLTVSQPLKGLEPG